MYFKQLYLACLSQASYLIGDERTGTAAVVDPRRDVDEYLALAAQHGLQIRHVLLTHFHADFVAGHLELRDRVGARIHLSARAEAEYDFEPAREEQPLVLGDVRLEFLETPGHTDSAISIVVHDRAASPDAPFAVLTGDTLFIGDVGRPDLLASAGVSARELASMLYDSLHGELLQLPDATRVYPGHGAGSLCGRSLSADTVSTIGEQRRYNYALQPMEREAFIALVTADQPEAPPYFGYDALLNKQERPTLERTLARSLVPLALDEVLVLAQGGAQLVDVRDAAAFAGGHLAGSLSLPLGGSYATWAGTLLDKDRPIVLVAEPGAEQEAATRLGRVGLDTVRGYLDGGMLALADRADLVRQVERVTAPALAELLALAEPPLVLDVRTEREWRAGHIEGSLNVPLAKLRARLAELPRGRRLAVHCQSGYRSSIASSLLLAHGITGFHDLVGGFAGWQAARLETAAAS